MDAIPLLPQKFSRQQFKQIQLSGEERAEQNSFTLLPAVAHGKKHK